jgi:hypothetical protein
MLDGKITININDQKKIKKKTHNVWWK